jgi:hypothetical protein
MYIALAPWKCSPAINAAAVPTNPSLHDHTLNFHFSRAAEFLQAEDVDLRDVNTLATDGSEDEAESLVGDTEKGAPKEVFQAMATKKIRQQLAGLGPTAVLREIVGAADDAKVKEVRLPLCLPWRLTL